MTRDVAATNMPTDVVVHGWLGQGTKALVCHGQLDKARGWASVCWVKHIDALEGVKHN